MLIIGLQSLTLSAGHCSNIHDDTVIYTDGSIDISISNHERASLVDKYLRSIIPGLIVGGGVKRDLSVVFLIILLQIFGYLLG